MDEHHAVLIEANIFRETIKYKLDHSSVFIYVSSHEKKNSFHGYYYAWWQVENGNGVVILIKLKDLISGC